MDAFIFVKYLHYIGVLGIVSAVAAEHLLLRGELYRHEIRRLFVLDGIYGFSAVVVLAAGLLMWFVVGKPDGFYTRNWIFHTKIFLFIIVGLLSLIPTVFFIRNRKGRRDDLVTVPQHLKMIIRLELLLLLLIPLLAVLMAHGKGSF
jgi:putative membrane protein